MKKIAVLFLCMMVLLSGCASLQLRDLKLESGEDVLDLTGVTVSVEAAQKDGVIGGRLRVDKQGETQVEAMAAVLGEQALIVWSDIQGHGGSYVSEDPESAAALREGLAWALTAQELVSEPGAEEMTDEQMQQLMDQIKERLEATMAEYSQGDLDAMTAQMDANAEKAAEILERCFSVGEPFELNGVSYDTVYLDLSHEDLMQLMGSTDLSEALGEEMDLEQAMAELGLTLSLTGTVYSGPDGTALYILTPTLADDTGESVNFMLVLDKTGEQGVTDVTFTAQQDGEALINSAITVVISGESDSAWLPESVPADAQVIQDVSGEELEGMLSADLEAFAQSITENVLGAAAEAVE